MTRRRSGTPQTTRRRSVTPLRSPCELDVGKNQAPNTPQVARERAGGRGARGKNQTAWCPEDRQTARCPEQHQSARRTQAKKRVPPHPDSETSSRHRRQVATGRSLTIGERAALPAVRLRKARPSPAPGRERRWSRYVHRVSRPARRRGQGWTLGDSRVSHRATAAPSVPRGEAPPPDL